MRPKSLILLVLALGCGLVASIGINRVMANRPAAEVVEGESVTLFVAAADVNQHDMVPKEAINWRPHRWPMRWLWCPTATVSNRVVQSLRSCCISPELGSLSPWISSIRSDAPFVTYAFRSPTAVISAALTACRKKV